MEFTKDQVRKSLSAAISDTGVCYETEEAIKTAEKMMDNLGITVKPPLPTDRKWYPGLSGMTIQVDTDNVLREKLIELRPGFDTMPSHKETLQELIAYLCKLHNAEVERGK